MHRRRGEADRNALAHLMRGRRASFRNTGLVRRRHDHRRPQGALSGPHDDDDFAKRSRPVRTRGGCRRYHVEFPLPPAPPGGSALARGLYALTVLGKPVEGDDLPATGMTPADMVRDAAKSGVMMKISSDANARRLSVYASPANESRRFGKRSRLFRSAWLVNRLPTRNSVSVVGSWQAGSGSNLRITDISIASKTPRSID
jgi:hypothetical protein